MKMVESINELVGTEYRGFKIIHAKRENGRGYVFIECPICHKQKWIRKDTLDHHGVKSCGCLNKQTRFKPAEIKGQRSGRLVALEPLEERKNGEVIWKCRCDCGNMTEVAASKLISGEIRSCGCLLKEHGKTIGAKNLKKFEKKDCVDNTKLASLSDTMPKNNTSGVKGVFWDSSREKWTAQIGFQGKNYRLGRYENIEDAEKARKSAEEEMFAPMLDKHEGEMMVEKRTVMFYKSKTSYQYKLSLPSRMVKKLGITFDDREVVLKMEDNKIIIEKINKEQENGTGEQEYNDK